jgi:diacylglycerol O-acyltransferase
MRIGVAMMTYAEQAAVGVTADFAAVPEVSDFAAAVTDEMSRLRPVRSTTKRATRRTARAA